MYDEIKIKIDITKEVREFCYKIARYDFCDIKGHELLVNTFLGSFQINFDTTWKHYGELGCKINLENIEILDIEGSFIKNNERLDLIIFEDEYIFKEI